MIDGSYLPSVSPGTRSQDYQNTSSVAPAYPVYNSLAKSDFDLMLKDPDVQGLPADVRLALQKFGVQLIQSFSVSGSCRIAVFGDPEEEAGEIVFLDRSTARQANLTVKADVADVWMRGPTNKQFFVGVRPEQIQFLSAIFGRLK